MKNVLGQDSGAMGMYAHFQALALCSSGVQFCADAAQKLLCWQVCMLNEYAGAQQLYQHEGAGRQLRQAGQLHGCNVLHRFVLQEN